MSSSAWCNVLFRGRPHRLTASEQQAVPTAWATQVCVTTLWDVHTVTKSSNNTSLRAYPQRHTEHDYSLIELLFPALFISLSRSRFSEGIVFSLPEVLPLVSTVKNTSADGESLQLPYVWKGVYFFKHLNFSFWSNLRLTRSGTLHHLSPKLTSHITRVYFQNLIN